MDTSNVKNNQPIMIPNMYEPSKPLTIVTIPNSITLTSTNYVSWKTQVEAILIGYDLHKHFDGTFVAPPPTTIAYQTWFRQDKLIFGALIGTLSSDLVPLVSHATTTLDLWDSLANIFSDKNDESKTMTTQVEHINSLCTTITHQVIDLTSLTSSPVKGANATSASVSLCSPIPKRRRKNQVNESNQRSEQVDRISKLPDDILVHILSFVELKTAGRTSLISKRWRHLWTHQKNLNFEDSEYYSQREFRPTESARQRYLNWVNKVISLSRASHLNSFSIHFPLKGSHAGHINKWLKFALTKNVASLALNFSCTKGYLNGDYKMDRDFLLIRGPTYNDNKHLTRLKSLHLEGLSMDGPSTVENVLAYCVNLEHLTVMMCKFDSLTLIPGSRKIYALRRHRLVISSLKLKHLQLHASNEIEILEIFAPKLTTLILFVGWTTAVKYTSIPSLVNATFASGYPYKVYNDFNLISNVSYQLQKLSISWNRVTSSPIVSPLHNKDNLLFLISFIKACPLLHTFKLELQPLTIEGDPMSAIENSARIKVKRHRYANQCHHQHLKVLEIVGFEASLSVAEFAICVTEIAPMLNKIICDPHCPPCYGNLHKFIDIEQADRIDRARREGKLLANHIRRGIHLSIL